MERGESVTNVISLKHPVYGGEIDIIGIYEVGAALDLAVQHYGNNYRDPNSRGEDDGGGEGADIPPQTCNNVYRDDDGNVCGHCLAAYVLSLCGVPDEELERYNKTSISETIRGLHIDVSDKAKEMLLVAQRVQDHGGTWHQAKEGGKALLY